jgi:hypothetical protein
MTSVRCFACSCHEPLPQPPAIPDAKTTLDAAVIAAHNIAEAIVVFDITGPSTHPIEGHDPKMRTKLLG